MMYTETLSTRSPWSFGELVLIRIAENESDLKEHGIDLIPRTKFINDLQQCAEDARCKIYFEEYVSEFYRHMLRGYVEVANEKRYFFNFSGLTSEENFSKNNFQTMKSAIAYVGM